MCVLQLLCQLAFVACQQCVLLCKSGDGFCQGKNHAALPLQEQSSFYKTWLLCVISIFNDQKHKIMSSEHCCNRFAHVLWLRANCGICICTLLI